MRNFLYGDERRKLWRCKMKLIYIYIYMYMLIKIYIPMLIRFSYDKYKFQLN